MIQFKGALSNRLILIAEKLRLDLTLVDHLTALKLDLIFDLSWAIGVKGRRFPNCSRARPGIGRSVLEMRRRNLKPSAIYADIFCFAFPASDDLDFKPVVAGRHRNFRLVMRYVFDHSVTQYLASRGKLVVTELSAIVHNPKMHIFGPSIVDGGTNSYISWTIAPLLAIGYRNRDAFRNRICTNLRVSDTFYL